MKKRMNTITKDCARSDSDDAAAKNRMLFYFGGKVFFIAYDNLRVSRF